MVSVWMTTMIFKTTDFKRGDVVVYRMYNNTSCIMELLNKHKKYTDNYYYRIIAHPEDPTLNGRSNFLWFMSLNNFANNVVAKC
jgi:hypothetical protein